MVEEAKEAAQVVGSREDLVEELADVREVMAALMAARGITDRDVAEAAAAKVLRRGAFDSGVWLISPVPTAIRRYTVGDVESQRIGWNPSR